MLSRWLRQLLDTEELSVDCTAVLGISVFSPFHMSVSSCRVSTARLYPQPGARHARAYGLGHPAVCADWVLIVVVAPSLEFTQRR